MVHINQRRGTAASWVSSNPVLQLGEVGWETDTLKSKLGDGTTHWNSLAYTAAGGGSFTATAHPTFPGVFTLSGSGSGGGTPVTPVAPVITAQPPTDSAANIGAPLVVVAAASGTPAPTCQWQVLADDGTGSGPQVWNVITGATQATFTITSAIITYTGLTSGTTLTEVRNGTSVRCVFTNSAGSVTSNASVLHDNSAPTLPTVSGSGTSGILGGSASISAGWTGGYPYPSVQWQKNVSGTWTNLTPSSTVVISNLFGIVGRQLDISPLAVGDAGSYRYVATNSLGSVTCTPFSIKVATPVVAFPSAFYTTSPSFGAFGTVGGTGVLNSTNADATGGTPTVTYQWQKADTYFGSTFSNIAGATSKQYTFTWTADCKFRCIGTNSYGSTTSSIIDCSASG